MTAGSDIENGCASSLTDRLRFGEPRQQRPPGRVGKRRKGAVERGFSIVNHMVKCIGSGWPLCRQYNRPQRVSFTTVSPR